MLRPLRPCPFPGCPELVRKDDDCPIHRRPTARERGYSPEWDAFSRAIRAANPRCTLCGRPSQETHHDTPLRAGGSLLDSRITVPLCTSCHVRITATTRSTPPSSRRKR